MRSAMWERVDIQASVFIAVIVALLSYSMSTVQHKTTYQDMLRDLNDQTERTYTYVGKRFELNTFKHIFAREDMLRENCTRVHDRFQRAREVTGTTYLYTAKMGENEELVYATDYSGPGAEDFKYPGDPIGWEIYPDMECAMQDEVAIPGEIKRTDRGRIFITYTPVYEGDEVIGVIRIEFKADHQYRTYQSLGRALPVFILLLSLIACLISRFLFRHTSNPFYRGMSNIDYLTQLKNRNTHRLDVDNSETKKMESRIGFILVSLNSLKHINSILGRGMGDRYTICIFEAYLNTHTGGGVTYRIGGDELVVMMPEATQAGTENLTARLEREFDKLALWPEFTLSWGSIISGEETGDNLLSVRRRVDKNMYMKKQKYYEDRKA